MGPTAELKRDEQENVLVDKTAKPEESLLEHCDGQFYACNQAVALSYSVKH